jgi:hypothetical protein
MAPINTFFQGYAISARPLIPIPRRRVKSRSVVLILMPVFAFGLRFKVYALM